jgi:circadian clock protein KaiB
MTETARVSPVEEVQVDHAAYRLRLFVAGDERVSRLAKENLAAICEAHLHDRHQLEIIDVLVDFHAALEQNVFVTPALILLVPLPRVTILGSLSDTSKVLAALGLTKGST